MVEGIYAFPNDSYVFEVLNQVVNLLTNIKAQLAAGLGLGQNCYLITKTGAW